MAATLGQQCGGRSRQGLRRHARRTRTHRNCATHVPGHARSRLVRRGRQTVSALARDRPDASRAAARRRRAAARRARRRDRCRDGELLRPPCSAAGRHHYRFHVYAIDTCEARVLLAAFGIPLARAHGRVATATRDPVGRVTRDCCRTRSVVGAGRQEAGKSSRRKRDPEASRSSGKHPEVELTSRTTRGLSILKDSKLKLRNYP